MVKAKPKKQPIVTIALPSVLHANVSNQQALRDAFRADLQAVLKPGSDSGNGNDINVGKVAVDVAVVKGFGRRRAPRRKPAKKAAKK